ncbi:MAG TPA: hypothetical protein VF928_15745 [Usitatibacteraceae bacterium]
MSRYAQTQSLEQSRSLFKVFADLVAPLTARARSGEPPARRIVPRAKELRFQENRGLTYAEVQYLACCPDYSVFLTSAEAILVLPGRSPERGSPAGYGSPARATPVVVRMTIESGLPNPCVSAVEEPAEPAATSTSIVPERRSSSFYTSVRYQNVYPGIDVVYMGGQQHLQQDFLIAPRADPHCIILAIQGAYQVDINRHGDLALRAAGGTLILQKPSIRQEKGGIVRAVPGQYVLRPGKRVGIRVAEYDRDDPMLITCGLRFLQGSRETSAVDEARAMPA